jgi:hypothetical protein
MNTKFWLIACLAATMALPALTWARNYQLHNRFRFEYDDNIYQRETDVTDSLKIVEEVEFLVNFDLENTFVTLRYKPSFMWWENREPDSTDLHHSFDFNLRHSFTPRLVLGIKDTFRYAEQPESIEDGVVVRQQGDYIFNSLSGTLAFQVIPSGQLEGSGRYTLLRYDETEVSATNDYDIYVAGLTYRHRLLPETSLAVDTRFESTEYNDRVTRNADSVMGGLGLEHTFSPNLLANVSGGLMNKTYDAEDISSETAPYGGFGVTLVPSPRTRISAGGSFSLREADIFPYVNQNYYRAYLGVSHDLTARVTVNTMGSYGYSEYKADEALPVELAERGLDEIGDGTEETLQLSARTTYQVNHSNWLEAGWQFSQAESDLRRDFERNRIHIGWRTRL